MTLLIIAGVCLVLAQVVGIYALKTHKADLVFSVCMIGLLILAVVLGIFGAYHELH
ncbi:MAG: hypothetical protein J2P58_09605 [Acidimicrobiaceae bacterium]|nr:hypothetical protein [Acidimicrobiaceae bacterium]MBO0748103.1 hypothetical protein [Acidimicrobiaceae bacterium]